MDSNKYIKLIYERLKALDIERAILFGSYAYGTPEEDSDMDLLIITKDDFFPSSFREKLDIAIKIAKEIEDIREIIPIDLLVYTKPMFEKFVESNSLFAQEILTRGKILI